RSGSMLVVVTGCLPGGKMTNWIDSRVIAPAASGWSPAVPGLGRRAALRGLVAVAILWALAMLVCASLLAARESRSGFLTRDGACPPAGLSIPGEPNC